MENYTKSTIIFYIVTASVIAWITQASIEVIVFSKESLPQALIFDISLYELYVRLVVIITCNLLLLLFIKNKIIRENNFIHKTILNNVIPVCITNEEYEIVRANDSYWEIFGISTSTDKAVKCYDHRPGKSCHTEHCALAQVINGAQEFVCESIKESNNETRYFIVTARPFLDRDGKMIGIIESFQDITDRKKLEEEKEDLIGKLRESLNRVKLLSGLLPICSSCKKIRDDKGYWNQIETYIRDHSNADFSHSLCPECAKELYPDFFKKRS